MDKNLYIDASHPEETRIVLKSNLSIEEYEYENKNRVNFKNNIYLGTISRVVSRKDDTTFVGGKGNTADSNFSPTSSVITLAPVRIAIS